MGLTRAQLHQVDADPRRRVAEQSQRRLVAVLRMVGSPADPVQVGLVAVQQVVDRDPERRAQLRQGAERQPPL
jgi:hypothetical protein